MLVAQVHHVISLILLSIFVLGLLALDLGVFHRQAHAVSVRERSLATTEYLACLAERRSDRVIGAFLELVKG